MTAKELYQEVIAPGLFLFFGAAILGVLAFSFGG